MTRLLIATNNPGKLREYENLLADLPLTLTWPGQEGIELEVEETGESFRENAILKARAYARASGLLTLADDSGLEVDALGGEPGILSSRYAGPEADDEDRMRLLLRKLEGVPWEERTARFRCVIALATPQGEVWTTEGSCEGIIAFEPRGEHGFGYDPVFYLPQFGKTMAQLPPELKNRISHRARAAEKARAILRELMEGWVIGDYQLP
ncbi:MAG TPA: XTP/dITP diphosphatase [Anaerolineae bacterium]|nr:XTP/dITP diphosphatase [Anaerolineae bacterium]